MTKGLCHHCHGSNLELVITPSQLPICTNCANPQVERTYQKVPAATKITAIQMTKSFKVHTKEGTMLGYAGDYLATGINGEKYPINKEIFEKSYKLT